MALYASTLGAGVAITGLIIGLYSFSHTISNIFFGRMSARTGYKLPLLLGLAGDAVGMLLYSVSRLPFHLALVRLFHGASGGLSGPATMSIVAEHAGGRTGRIMAMYGISLAATTLVGYALSGFLVSRLGYEFLFYIAGGIMIIGIWLSLKLPGYREKHPTKATDWTKIKGLLRRGNILTSYSAIFAQYFSFGAVVTLLPLRVKSLGMEAMHVGILMAVFSIMFIIMQVPSGSMSDRKSRPLPIIIGLSIGIVSLLILPWFETFVLLAIGMGLYGVAYGMIFPASSAIAADVSTEERGTSTGIFHALLTAGVAIGAPVSGLLAESAGVNIALMLVSVIFFVALGVTFSTRRFKGLR